MAVKHSISE